MKTNKSHDINECFYLYYKHNQGRTIKVLAEEVSLSESTVNRKRIRLTQEQLAEKCNVSRQAVTKWESGV